MSSVIPMTIGH